MTSPTGIFVITANDDRYTHTQQGAALTIETARDVAEAALRDKAVKAVGEWHQDVSPTGMSGMSREVHFISLDNDGQPRYGHLGWQKIEWSALTPEPVQPLTPRDFVEFYVIENEGGKHTDTGHNLDSVKCKRPVNSGKRSFDPCRMCEALHLLDGDALTALDFVQFYLLRHGDEAYDLAGHAPESVHCRVPAMCEQTANYPCRMCSAISLLAPVVHG